MNIIKFNFFDYHQLMCARELTVFEYMYEICIGWVIGEILVKQGIGPGFGFWIGQDLLLGFKAHYL